MVRDEKLVKSSGSKPYDLSTMLGRNKDTEKLRYILTLEERDKALESLWEEFGDVTMNPETECIEAAFYDFPAGTHRYDIWHWFDERHSKGVRYLLYREAESPLMSFLKEEVPYRLIDVLEYPEEKITPRVIGCCVQTLYNNSETLFDGDTFDRMLEEVCRDLNLEPSPKVYIPEDEEE